MQDLYLVPTSPTMLGHAGQQQHTHASELLQPQTRRSDASQVRPPVFGEGQRAQKQNKAKQSHDSPRLLFPAIGGMRSPPELNESLSFSDAASSCPFHHESSASAADAGESGWSGPLAPKRLSPSSPTCPETAKATTWPGYKRTGTAGPPNESSRCSISHHPLRHYPLLADTSFSTFPRSIATSLLHV